MNKMHPGPLGSSVGRVPQGQNYLENRKEKWMVKRAKVPRLPGAGGD